MVNQLSKSIQNDFFSHLIKGDRKECSALSRQYLKENTSIKDLYEDVFKDALYKVGKLWETNNISVATEHLATAITEGILNELYDVLEFEETQNKKIILTCVENEMHQVGIKMVADVFEMQGWESHFLGTGIPFNELVKYIKEINPQAIAISLSIYFNFQNLLKTVSALQQQFPQLQIITGGQAFSKLNEDELKKLVGVKYILNLYELEEYLKTI